MLLIGVSGMESGERMTKEEILSAVSMRIDGYTWKSIANQLHYSDVTVRESISKLIQSPRKTAGGKFMYVIFPNVRSWMRDEGVSCHKISCETHYCEASIRDQLSGRSKMNPIVVKKIMQMSGMTYDEVISLEGGNSDAEKNTG